MTWGIANPLSFRGCGATEESVSFLQGVRIPRRWLGMTEEQRSCATISGTAYGGSGVLLGLGAEVEGDDRGDHDHHIVRGDVAL